MPANPAARSAIAAAAVLFSSVATVLAVRGVQKPYAPQAPAFRQQGAETSKIVIVEYSDFQCPACRAAVKPMKDILKLYGAETRFIFKHFPLEHAHRWARLAAKSAECAGRQGKFWDFHDLVYETQEEWAGDDGDKKLAAYSKALGLSEPAFSTCLADPSVEALITAEEKEGDDRWVGSTPTFFINGKRFVGAKQLSMRGPLWIDKLLKK